MVQADFDRIKKGLNLYSETTDYKREIIVTERLTADELDRLHASCDCYVQASHGEGWGIPLFDAMGFGKTPISTAYGAATDYLNFESGWLVPGDMEPVRGMAHVHPDLYTARQKWCSPDLSMLRQAMREAFEQPFTRSRKRAAGKRRAMEYSYKNIGLKLKAILEK